MHYQPCICRSKALLDPYGDHLFSCQAASKIPIHNRIRDTCFHILTKLAPIANITSNVTDIQLEPPNVLPSYPTLRPADIGLHLIPTPNLQNLHDSDPFLAIDVTFTPTPSPPSLTASSSDRPEKQTNTTKVHDESARQKFNVPHAFALLTHNIILLPVTFDPLGGIGSFATEFFFGTPKEPPLIHSNSSPTWSPQSFPHNPDAYLLYQRTATQAPKNILSRADFHWFNGSHQNRPYGPTYHTASPSAWATQTLGLNLIQGLAQHCHNAIEKIVHHHQTQRLSFRKTQQQLKTFSPFYFQTSKFADPAFGFHSTSPTPHLTTATGDTHYAG
jgi:hypothetical protein